MRDIYRMEFEAGSTLDAKTSLGRKAQKGPKKGETCLFCFFWCFFSMQSKGPQQVFQSLGWVLFYLAAVIIFSTWDTRENSQGTTPKRNKTWLLNMVVEHGVDKDDVEHGSVSKHLVVVGKQLFTFFLIVV